MTFEVSARLSGDIVAEDGGVDQRGYPCDPYVRIIADETGRSRKECTMFPGIRPNDRDIAVKVCQDLSKRFAARERRRRAQRCEANGSAVERSEICGVISRLDPLDRQSRR